VQPRIIDRGGARGYGGYEKLSFLCDRIGNRFVCSPALDRAIQWAAAQMKKDGWKT